MTQANSSGHVKLAKTSYISTSASVVALNGCSVIIEEHCTIFDNVKIACEEKPGSIIIIGCNSRVQRGTEICGNVKVGSNVIIGPNCLISSGQHIFALDPLLPIDLQDLLFSVICAHVPSMTTNDQPIIVKDNAYIGKNVVILPGTTVARGSVVAANSVVTNDTEPYSVFGGTPAKRISTVLPRYT
jgi:acetyltransferase-like isoleucine patch superfamily enzyme